MDIQLLGSGKYEYRLIGPTQQELQQLMVRNQGNKQAHKIIVWDTEKDQAAEGVQLQMGRPVKNRLSPIIVAAGGGFANIPDKVTLRMAAGSEPIAKEVFFNGQSLDPNNLPADLRQTGDIQRTLTNFMAPLGAPQQYIGNQIVRTNAAGAQAPSQPSAPQPAPSVQIENASPETPLNKVTAGVVAGTNGTTYRLVATGTDGSSLALQAEAPGNGGRGYASFDPSGSAPAEMLVIQEKGTIKPPFDKGEAYVKFPDYSRVDLSQVYNATTGKPLPPEQTQAFSGAMATLKPVGNNLQIARQANAAPATTAQGTTVGNSSATTQATSVDNGAATEVRVTTTASKHYSFVTSGNGILTIENGGTSAGIVYPSDPQYKNQALDGKPGGARGEMALLQYNGNPKGVFEKVTGPVKIEFPAGATIDLNVIDSKTKKPATNQEQFRGIISRLVPVGADLKVTKNTALEGGTPAAPATPTMPEPPKAEPKPEPKPAAPAIDPAIASLREALDKVKKADAAWKTSAGVPDAQAFDDFFQRSDGDPRSLGAAFKSLEELAGKDTWTAADKQAAKKFAAQFEKSTDDLTGNKKLLNNRNRSGSGETDRQLIQELNGIAPDINKAVDAVTPNYKSAAVTTPHPFESLVAAHSEPKFPVSDASTGYSAVPGGRNGGISMGA